MKTFLMLISVWLLCAATTVHSLRIERSISESTRSHNEYDRSDARGHRERDNNIDKSPESCVPGTTWQNNCNSCWCSQHGVAACTLMACLAADHNNNALTNIHNRHISQTMFRHPASRNSIRDGDKHSRVERSAGDNEKKCVPGTRWKQDCNNCWCTETGIGACTLMGCLHFSGSGPTEPTHNRQKRSSTDTPTRLQNSVPENEKNCKNGTTWMKSCNRCRCFGGRAACTRMRCLEREADI